METRVANCLNLLRGVQFGDFHSEDQTSVLDVTEDFFTAHSPDSDDADSDCEDTINCSLVSGRHTALYISNTHHRTIIIDKLVQTCKYTYNHK